MHCCGAVSHVGLVQGKCEANPRRARLDIRASPIASAERLLLAAKKRTKIVRLIELLLVSAALDSVDGAGNLVGAVVPEPTRVTETHRLVAGLRRRQTDFVVGGGVPELLKTRHQYFHTRKPNEDTTFSSLEHRHPQSAFRHSEHIAKHNTAEKLSTSACVKQSARPFSSALQLPHMQKRWKT